MDATERTCRSHPPPLCDEAFFLPSVMRPRRSRGRKKYRIRTDRRPCEPSSSSITLFSLFPFFFFLSEMSLEHLGMAETNCSTRTSSRTNALPPSEEEGGRRNAESISGQRRRDLFFFSLFFLLPFSQPSSFFLQHQFSASAVMSANLSFQFLENFFSLLLIKDLLFSPSPPPFFFEQP